MTDNGVVIAGQYVGVFGVPVVSVNVNCNKNMLVYKHASYHVEMSRLYCMDYGELK